MAANTPSGYSGSVQDGAPAAVASPGMSAASSSPDPALPENHPLPPSSTTSPVPAQRLSGEQKLLEPASSAWWTEPKPAMDAAGEAASSPARPPAVGTTAEKADLTEAVTASLRRMEINCPEREDAVAAMKQKMATLQMPVLKGNVRQRPLKLLELPVDVLKDIVKEVSHTNDLCNLCLTCRALHHLAVPQIYSRFDIVWPEGVGTGERAGVDALTHGLATLTNITRRGNNHAQWVKKFSLGNGPSEWIKEYNIDKEGGKMLGTLVNLALDRMDRLETFSWDMPTGVLRDVFMTLHDKSDLKNVHVRFHNSHEMTMRQIEQPTFKGFKNLRSLSVLDMDEREYLKEIAHAIGDSAETLKELRLGIAHHRAFSRRWIRDLDELENTNAPISDDAVVGGVLGIIFGRIVNVEEGRRRRRAPRPQDTPTPAAPGSAENASVGTAEAEVMTPAAPAEVFLNTSSTGAATGQAPGPGNAIPAPASTPPPPAVTAPFVITPALPLPQFTPSAPVAQRTAVHEEESHPQKQLKLESLSLERMPLPVYILVNSRAIDWTHLTSLTILDCSNHERLWKVLRRKFSPFITASTGSSNTSNTNSNPANFHRHRQSLNLPAPKPSEFKLRLKKIHTDCVTVHLVAFIRDSLAPNSLETLFLQETTRNTNTVTMDVIFKGAIRRHKGSLKKLLVDSRTEEVGEFAKWTVTREMIQYMSSGKCPKLRELGVAIDHKDWHFFLTRLPLIPHLRSLYITRIRDAPHILGPVPSARELAAQILNTIVLRPEIELCYLGIQDKCYEILETAASAFDPDSDGDLDNIASLSSSTVTATGPGGAGTANGGAQTGAAGPSGIVDEESEDEDVDADAELGSEEEEDWAVESEEEEEPKREREKPCRIRLREILFYDDKVEVFRARSARL